MGRKAAVAATVALLSAGCARSNLPDYVKIEGLRVLAIKTTPPEVTPGSTAVVSVSALISDIKGDDRALTYTATGCLDPGIAYGADPNCDSSADKVTWSTGSVGSLKGANSSYTGTAPSFNVIVPSYVLTGRTDIDKYNGVSYIVVYDLSSSDGTRLLRTIKRITASASTKTSKNANPSISSVTQGTSTLSVAPTLTTLPSSAVELKVNPGTEESYTAMNSDGSTSSYTETLTTTWFITDGSVDRFRTVSTDANSWTPPSARPSNRGVTVVAVTRDGRGGEDFKVIEY